MKYLEVLIKNQHQKVFNTTHLVHMHATKACAEMLVNSYHVTYDCDTLITRCTNNYGPRQFPEKLIPKTLLLAKNNKKIPIYGTGKNLRDWLHVDDHCTAILSCNYIMENLESHIIFHQVMKLII